MSYTRSLLLSFLFLLIGSVMGATASHGAENGAPGGRITIEADRMESMQKENAVMFSGNVEAKQGDLNIHADNMVIYYLAAAQAAQPGTASQNIDKLVASGNVKLVKEGWVASGDTVDYYATERKVIITGNTKVLRDNNMITGQRIVLFLDEGKSVVECDNENGGRVKAIISPGSGK